MIQWTELQSSPYASKIFQSPNSLCGLTMAEPTNEVAVESMTASATSGRRHEVAPDEDCSKTFTPVIQLAEVKTETGEENEEVIFKIRSKLFRYSKELGEWKERGTGDVRILKHKTTSKIRLLMRREKTLKICLNQYVSPQAELQENVGSDRSWVWQGVDYADGEKDEATLAIRFKDSNSAKLFKEAYDSAREAMKNLNKPPGVGEAATDGSKANASAAKAPAGERKEPQPAASEEKESASSN